MRHDSKGIMDHAFLRCLLLPLFSILWPVAGNDIKYAPLSPSYNQSRGGKNCFLTTKCDNCSQSEINCYDDAQLQPLYDNQFHDYFCGPHRVVLVNAEVGEQHRLSPLKCRDGKCPDGSGCLKNPADDIFYCCATGSDDSTNGSAKGDVAKQTHKSTKSVQSNGGDTEDRNEKDNMSNSVTNSYLDPVSEFSIVVDTFPTEDTAAEDMEIVRAGCDAD